MLESCADQSIPEWTGGQILSCCRSNKTIAPWASSFECMYGGAQWTRTGFLPSLSPSSILVQPTSLGFQVPIGRRLLGSRSKETEEHLAPTGRREGKTDMKEKGAASPSCAHAQPAMRCCKV